MVIELPDLYQHQQTMRDEARAAMRKYQRVILCAPPGTGKTRISKWILSSFANRPTNEGESGKALFVVHRRGLVDNASNSFGQTPVLPHGVIMSQRKTRLDEPIQVASIDTVLAWYCEDGKFTGDTYDLIIMDEIHAHVQKFRTLLGPHDEKRVAHGMKPAYVLGLSATPQHKDLNQIFKTIVSGPSPQWLIDNGYLSPFRYFRATQGNKGLLVKKGDEYTEDSVSAAMQGLSGDMLKDWLRLAEGRATVGFFPRRTHAAEAVEQFCAAGVKAVYLDGETPDEERLQMFSDLNEGRIDYIANVGVIERGTDIPRIGCVQMCTFVGSIVRWVQMIGRGSRVHPEVPDCLVLDHGDGVQKGWFFEDAVQWSLDWGERPAKTHQASPTIQCPKCGLSYRGGKCKCGYEPTKRERKAQGLEFIGGELQEVQKPEKKKKLKSNEELMISSLYRAAYAGLNFSAACAMARKAAEKQGTIDFTVPAYVTVGDTLYKMIPWGHADSKLPVKLTYGVFVKNYSLDANPYRER